MKKEQLEKLSDKEIEQMMKNLSEIKKQRAKTIEDGLKNKNAVVLKMYLETHQYSLPEHLSKHINFSSFVEKDIDFIEQLSKTKQWKNLLNEYPHGYFFLKSVTANPELTQYFIDHHTDVFKEQFLQRMRQSAFHISNEDVMKKLFDYVIDHKEDTNLLHNFSLNSELLIYGIEKQYILPSLSQLLPCIYHAFPNCTVDNLEKLLSFLPENTILNFKDLQESLYDVHMGDDNEYEEKMLSFVNVSEDNFSVMVKSIDIPLDYVQACLESIKHKTVDDDVYEAETLPLKRANIVTLILESVARHVKENELINSFVKDLKLDSLDTELKNNIRRSILNAKLKNNLIDKPDSLHKIKI